MKKFIIISLITVMVAGAAFADTAGGISINAWGRGSFSPLTLQTAPKVYGDAVPDDITPTDDAKGRVYAGSGATWGADLIRTDFRVNGDAEFIGFTIGLTESSAVDLFNNFAGNDNKANIWAKPFESDILKLIVGRYTEDTLRGKIGNLDGGFSNFVAGCSVTEEDAIFMRFTTSYGERRFWDNAEHGWGSSEGGFMVSSAPIEGLFIGVNVITDGWYKRFSLDPNDDSWDNSLQAADLYRFIQIGAGYEIADIGHIRAQFIGGYLGKYDNDKIKDKYVEKYFETPDAGLPARIEAAFALTAVENLLVDLGLRFWLPVEFSNAKVKHSKGIEAHVGAQFNADALGIGARIDATGLGAYTGRNTEGDTKKTDPMSIGVRVVPTFALDAFTIGADIGFGITAGGKAHNGDKIESSTVGLGFGAFIMKGLGNGNVKAGVTFTTADIRKDKFGDETKSGACGTGILQIPIILEYAFF